VKLIVLPSQSRRS